MALKMSMDSLSALSFPAAYKGTCAMTVSVGGTLVRVYAEVHTGKKYYEATLRVGEFGEKALLKFGNINEVVGLYEALEKAIDLFHVSELEAMVAPVLGEDVKP